MLRKIFSSAIAMAATSAALAQDTTEKAAAKPIISGYADVYYRFNFSNPQKDLETFNNYTSFTNSHNSFELGMASVKLEHTLGKVGMVADVGFGKRAEEFSYNDDNTQFAIKQLYLSYAPVQNIKLTAGSWATHVGYELVDAYANRNYSMSYMFSKGPFFHTGLKTDILVGRSSFMLGISNPTDLKSANFSHKFIVAQYSLTSRNEQTKVFLNVQGGKTDFAHKIRQADIVITNALSSNFSIGYNGTITAVQSKSNGKFESAQSWWGSALYLNADPASWLGLTLRAEYFEDKNRVTDVFAAQPIGGNVFATTLSANFKISNLTIIPEFRLDKGSEPIFTKHTGTATKSTATALLAAIYKF